MSNLSGNYSFIKITSVTCIPVGVIGILTNFFLLVILSTSKSLRDPSYRIIANVIACDCISSIQFFVVFLGPHLLRNSTFNTCRIYCKFLIYSLYSTYNASALSLTAVSLYRYRLVIKASQIRFRKFELRKINRLLAIIWAASFVFAIPMIFFSEGNNITTGNCDIGYIPNYSYLTFIYFLCVTMVTYVTPLIIMVCNYTRLIKQLKNYVIPGDNRISNINRRHDNIIRMLLAVTSAFMLFNCPLFISISFMASSAKTYYLLRRDSLILYYICLLALPLAVFVSIINPILYITFDKNISKEVKQRFTFELVDSMRTQSTPARPKPRVVFIQSS
ncbi:Rhodopsin, GQ-coupled [Trichoplax sp. H2]|nr:Rhodopsin, GQ-coupled [Trichoplax sp. H2]|eukprot:RDD36504.1 Rhodopsin, GQ-coupled [Trichoplax sp. H2]